VQLEETDLAFIERLLASVGIAYYFTEHEGRDVLHFSDDNAAFTKVELGPIPFISDAGLDKPMACFNKFLKGIRQVPLHAQVVDYNYLTPENLIKAGQIPSKEDPAFVHFGSGTSHQDEAEIKQRVIEQRYALEAHNIQIKGSVAGLYPGAVFSFVHPAYPQYCGDYLVMSMSHSLIQQAVIEHESDLGNLAYTQHAHLLPMSLTYRPALKPLPRLPTAFTARIESNGQYALLDEHGRFKVRMLFDTDQSAHSEASLPVRSVNLYNGPYTDSASGALFPYREGVEVIWGCVDGNPDQPIILGCLPNPANHSPVTSRNFADNIIRTGGKNELLMHDIQDEEHIELKQGDYDKPFNLMRLDANSAGHSIKFACTLGAMEVYAKQTMKVEAGDSITQTHGNNRTETIEDSSTLTTKNKDIHYQSATDQNHSASQNISHKAEKNIEHKSTETTQWRVSRDSIITIKQGDQIIKIDNGELHIQAAKGINIIGKGGGSIKIGQKGAGIEITAGGDVKLFGKKVTIDGKDGVKIKGKVEYKIAKGGSLSLAALVPLAVSAIEPIITSFGFSE
jgi:type VI secretion system secreted protein VgrG